MGNAVYLEVADKKVLSTEITYDDLVCLYRQFNNKYGRLPTTNDGKSKHNMPQRRIVNELLKNKGLTFNEFMLLFGRVSHVRTESKDYNLFLQKYINISKEIGHAINQAELINNTYALPSANWFVKYCPDNSVKTFDNFVLWCGFESNKLKIDDKLVAEKLIQLEKDLGRPIKRSDIKSDKIGFSSVVINRIWGSLGEAKKVLGLKDTITNNSKGLIYYKDLLDRTLEQIKLQEGRTFISWNDIESNKFIGQHSNHKTYIDAFKKENLDFYSYIKSQGYTMLPSSSGHTHMFDDGENVKSIFEYNFSKFLRENLNLRYNIDYFRDVQYKTFCKIKSKINCDYVVPIGNDFLYIEIAGMIYKNNVSDWRNSNYPSDRENRYRDKMILKENLLLKSGKSFLFLFPRDMLNETYKNTIINHIDSMRVKTA